MRPNRLLLKERYGQEQAIFQVKWRRCAVVAAGWNFCTKAWIVNWKF